MFAKLWEELERTRRTLLKPCSVGLFYPACGKNDTADEAQLISKHYFEWMLLDQSNIYVSSQPLLHQSYQNLFDCYCNQRQIQFLQYDCVPRLKSIG